MSALLTAAEKTRFLEWLDLEASSAKGLIEQMQKLSTPEEMIRRYKAEAMACEIVAKIIRSREEVLIPGRQD